MELSAGAAFFAAMFIILGSMAIIGWIADIIKKWHDKRHPKTKKKSLSINDPRFMR